MLVALSLADYLQTLYLLHMFGCDDMQWLINWFNAYPSRMLVTEWFIIMLLYMILAKCKRRKTPINKRRFVYCENGRKNNIVYVDLVSQYEFEHHDEFVWYPIIDMNNTSIYFALPPYED